MTITVFCEAKHAAGQELLFKARSMAPDARITALHEDRDADKYFFCGADTALFLGETEDDCAQGSRIAEVLSQQPSDIVLFPATVRGRFLSAWAAAKLHTGLTADCTELPITENGLRRPDGEHPLSGKKAPDGQRPPGGVSPARWMSSPGKRAGTGRLMRLLGNAHEAGGRGSHG